MLDAKCLQLRPEVGDGPLGFDQSLGEVDHPGIGDVEVDQRLPEREFVHLLLERVAASGRRFALHRHPSCCVGHTGGRAIRVWYVAASASAVLDQVYVAPVWRHDVICRLAIPGSVSRVSAASASAVGDQSRATTGTSPPTSARGPNATLTLGVPNPPPL